MRRILCVFAVVAFLGAVATLAGLKLWNPKDRYFVRYQQSKRPWLPGRPATQSLILDQPLGYYSLDGRSLRDKPRSTWPRGKEPTATELRGEVS